jgi:hypothetical protein
MSPYAFTQPLMLDNIIDPVRMARAQERLQQVNRPPMHGNNLNRKAYSSAVPGGTAPAASARDKMMVNWSFDFVDRLCNKNKNKSNSVASNPPPARAAGQHPQHHKRYMRN